MKNFTYSSKTRVYFGKGQIDSILSELKPYENKSILLVYGMKSIKNNGIYDRIKEICESLNISLIEESGVLSNPDVTSVRSGIKKCIDNSVKFIISAGGGSVIDCAKAIGIGVYSECDIWDIYRLKSKAVKSLPLGVIITLAATGSETNGNSVISNRELDEKRAVGYSFSIPEFAIVDPSYTLTVSRHHTLAGSIDIILHILEQYFANNKRTETSDYMSFGVIKSVIENTRRILNDEDDYDTRANLSWASTIGLNWILGVDKDGDWATHRLSYVLTKEYGTTHGYALVLLFISWMKVALKYNEETMTRRLNMLGENTFGVSGHKDTINAIESLFREFGANTNFADEGLLISDKKIDELVKSALELGNVGQVVEIDYDKALEIFNLSNIK